MCGQSNLPSILLRKPRNRLGHSLLSLPLLLVVSDAVTTLLADLEVDRCSDVGGNSINGANLLQTRRDLHDKEDAFGPGHCVRLFRSQDGSCTLKTQCKDKNVSDTEFAFVCFSPGSTMPYALHSFGRGGFEAEETFDTNVRCKTCMSVDTAFRTGGSVVRNALAALPLGRLPSLSGGPPSSPYSSADLVAFTPKEAAVFGPDYCISTFRAPAGSCLIRTRCPNADLSKFNVGLTCLDKSGGYTRYLFGKDTFKSEETFDTLISCEKCLGVGPESGMFATHGLLPRKLVEDVGTLKNDVQILNEKVRVLQDAHTIPTPTTRKGKEEGDAKEEQKSRGEEKEADATPDSTSKEADEAPKHTENKDKAHTTHFQQTSPTIRTILVSRAHGDASGIRHEQNVLARAASMDTEMHVVSHKRAPTITELFRRLQMRSHMKQI